MFDPSPDDTQASRFYRLQQVPLAAPLDLDGDGIDDVTELSFGNLLNPLNPADGLADPDGDGVSTAAEIRAGRNPFGAEKSVTTFTSSPAPSESGVSVNRETVLRFSRSLAPGTLLTSASLRAEAAGRELLTRIDLASDRRSVTLFYLEPLPGATRVRVTFDATAVRDDAGQLVDANGDALPGGVGAVEFDTFGNIAVPNTAVIGRVFASEFGTNQLGQPINRPLPGVIITVDGAEESLRTATDAAGRFTLSPAPSGRFFVHIDGRPAVGSVWPGGSYYPVVGKAWEAVAGKTNNLAGGTGEIFLPLIAAGALQTVSATLETRISFPAETLSKNPELKGVELTVPANALFSDNGTRGGRVGIAPVPSDRLPGPLPAGVFLPLVITVQTDGPSNFDRPVPAKFPNLPDPETGVILPPGAKTALVSFNHDTGDWEIAGSMTISADGKFAVSDPGSGIRQPGWHGTSPLSSGSGGGAGGGSGGGAGGGGGNNGGGGAGGGGGGGNGSGGGAGGGGDPDLAVAGESGFGDDSDDPGGPEEQSPADDGDPNPEFGDGPSACPGNDLARVEIKRPHCCSSPLPPDNFVSPDPTENGGTSPFRVLPNQIIRLTFKRTLSEGDSVAWEASSGNSSSGVDMEFRTGFGLNISTNLDRRVIRLIYRQKDREPVCQEIRFLVLPNSGAHWVAHFGVPAVVEELREPFRSNATSFIQAMREVGATVSIAATFRSQKRAYLMHMAGKVKENVAFALAPVLFRVNEIPDHDPFKGPLNITFAYLNAQGNLAVEASVSAAQAMCSAYGIAFPAGYPATRHGDRRAVDMTIRWDGTKQFRLGSPAAPGTGTGELFEFITITARKCSLGPGKAPDEHCNQALWLLV